MSEQIKCDCGCTVAIKNENKISIKCRKCKNKVKVGVLEDLGEAFKKQSAEYFLTNYFMEVYGVDNQKAKQMVNDTYKNSEYAKKLNNAETN